MSLPVENPVKKNKNEKRLIFFWNQTWGSLNFVEPQSNQNFSRYIKLIKMKNDGWTRNYWLQVEN